MFRGLSAAVSPLRRGILLGASGGLTLASGQSWGQSAQTMASTVATNTAEIVNWKHVSSLVSYEEWPTLPRWVKIALFAGTGCFLFYRAMRWVWNLRRLESVRRITRLYTTFIPIIVDYKLLERKVKRNKIDAEEEARLYDALDHKHAPRARRFCDDLAGAYTKVGQVIASRADIAPETWRKALAGCLDSVKPSPLPDIIAVVEADFKKPLCDLFDNFNAIPIGVASLSQVHVGRMKDGREVVVKVQLPEAHRLLMGDIIATNALMKLTNKAFKSVADEVEKQFESEFDFEREGRNLARIRENMRGIPNVAVPELYMATPRVLMMSFLPGKSFFANMHLPAPQRVTILSTIFNAMGKQLLIDGIFNGDPHPGNFLIGDDGTVGLIDFGQVKEFSNEMRLNLCKLIVAMTEGTNDEITDAAVGIGYVTKKRDVESIATTMRYMFDSRNAAQGGVSGPMSAMQTAMDKAPPISFPSEAMFAMRAALLLRGMAFMVPDAPSLLHAWLPMAKQALAEKV